MTQADDNPPKSFIRTVWMFLPKRTEPNHALVLPFVQRPDDRLENEDFESCMRLNHLWSVYRTLPSSTSRHAVIRAGRLLNSEYSTGTENNNTDKGVAWGLNGREEPRKRVMMGPKAHPERRTLNSDGRKRPVLKTLRPYPVGNRSSSRPQHQARRESSYTSLSYS